MSWLVILGGGTAVIAASASIGVAIGRLAVVLFGRLADVDGRDEERFL